MTYLDMEEKLYNSEKILRDNFLKEMRQIVIEIVEFDNIDKIKNYSSKYMELINREITRFKHFGSIELIMYSLGVKRNEEAFNGLVQSCYT